MMRYILFLFLVGFGLSASAQKNIVDELQKERAGQGKVTINQDAGIRLFGGSTRDLTQKSFTLLFFGDII